MYDIKRKKERKNVLSDFLIVIISNKISLPFSTLRQITISRLLS